MIRRHDAKSKAKVTEPVQVYLDPQCPFCAKFETGGGEGLAKAVRDGRAKAEYTVASFLDQGREGASTRAANALRAALDAGRFAEYHAALYASQPQEGSPDAYTPEHLLRIADQVKGKIKFSAAPSVARGENELAIQQVSELLGVPGVDYVGTLPDGAQLVTTYAAAIVEGSKEVENAKQLIAFLTAGAAAPAIRKSGMEQPQKR